MVATGGRRQDPLRVLTTGSCDGVVEAMARVLTDAGEDSSVRAPGVAIASVGGSRLPQRP